MSARKQQPCIVTETLPKYSVVEMRSDRRILIREKYSYCVLLEAWVKPEGCDSHCGGEHLAELLGGAGNTPAPSVLHLSVFQS